MNKAGEWGNGVLGGTSESGLEHQVPTARPIAMGDLAAASPEAHRPFGGAAGRGVMADGLSDHLHPLRRVKAKLTVCVGSAEVSIGELLDTQAQHVLRLDRTVEQPVDVLLEGQVVARGLLVAVDDHFAVRITELPGAQGGAGIER